MPRNPNAGSQQQQQRTTAPFPLTRDSCNLSLTELRQRQQEIGNTIAQFETLLKDWDDHTTRISAGTLNNTPSPGAQPRKPVSAARLAAIHKAQKVAVANRKKRAAAAGGAKK